MRPARFIFLIAALFLASLNLRPVITSVSPLLGTIQDALGISGSVASLLTSLPVLCMGFFAPAAVQLARRWSIERTIAYSLLLIGIATASRFFAHAPWLMLLSAFLAGIGIAIAGPLLSGFIKKNFPNPTAIVGVYSTALVVGAAMGSGFSVPLQHAFGESWQASVASWAALAFLALLFWWRPASGPNGKTVSIASAGATAASTSAAIAAGSAAGSTAAQPAPTGMQLPLRSNRAWLLTCFFGLMSFMFYSITAWLAPMVEDMGYDKQTAALVLTVFTLVQIPVSFLLPLLVSRFQHRAVWLVGCSALEMIGLLMLLFSVTPWLPSILLGIGAGGLFPMALMLPIDESSSTEEASALSAMTQSGGYMFAALGPFFVGFVHDYTGHFPPALLGMTVIVALMILVQLRIGNKKPAQQQKNA